MNKRIYITTTIPYVNSTPHVGFALELVQADVLSRYHRLLGRPTRLQTGTDENALKNVLAAKEEGITPIELVARNAKAFRELTVALNIKLDRFIRTTECQHRAGVHWLWKRLRTGDVYRQSYRGLYCRGCEDFYLEKDLTNGLCPIHHRRPTEVAEQNYFFRLSAYQSQIEEVLETGRLRVVPDARRNEILSFVRSGLRDFSITRSTERAYGWGIEVPDDNSQIIYVWLDALTNYLSGLGYGTDEECAEFWEEDTLKIHVLGKDVWKFHAVYWPAFLLSAGLPLPDTVLIHGFLTVNGRKISKTLGNVVDPFRLVRRYGSDAVRYYLARALVPFEDGDFSTERLNHLYNADLANGLGNLVSRLTSLCGKAEYGHYGTDGAPQAPEGYHEALDEYRFDRALSALWETIGSINRDIEVTKPWEWLRDNRYELLHQKLSEWLGSLYGIGYWVQPFLPDAGKSILDALSEEKVTSGPPLFHRIR